MKNTALSRREFTFLAAAAPAILNGKSTASDAARIKIDTARTIGEIDPRLYGNFLEHLGRCIEGGVFEEGSPLSDQEGFRKDVMEAASNLHVSLLRWPGGNFSSNYNWRDGIGPRDSRPRRLEMAWGTVEDNRFGTHEFLDYVQEIKARPYICANFGTGTWDEAQQWVEYVNSDADTATTRLRKQNGREQPWKVKLWGLGNEMDGPWQMGHRTADDYGKFALEGAKLMHWTDKDIELVAAGSANFGADWIGWNRTVLSYLKEHIHYLSLHMYVGNKENDYYEFQASTLDMAHRIKVVEGLIDEALFDGPSGKKIYQAWDEWNVWYRARGGDLERGRRILEEHYNLEDALVISSFLNTFVNHAHTVKIANMAQLVNVIAPIFTSDKGLYLQTIYYPLQLFANHCHGTALDLAVDCPTYTTKRGQAPYLDVSAARNTDGTLVVNVTNRHRDQPMEAAIEVEDGEFSGNFSVYEVNGPDIKAENDFGKTTVKTIQQKSIPANGKLVKYSFPAHSFTMLKGLLRS